MIRYFLFLLFIVSAPVQAAETMLCDEVKKSAIYKSNKHYYKIEEGRDGWLFRTKTDFQTDFTVDDLTIQSLKELNKALKTQDIQLIVALLPTRGMVHHDKVLSETYNSQIAIQAYRELVSDLEQVGLHIASIDSFEENDFYYERDHHWTAEGANLMAEAIAAEMKALPTYSDLQKKKFKTDMVGEEHRAGSFSDFVQEICGTQISDETIKMYKTYSVEEDSLFGDMAKPEILLIGTSNSDQKASQSNFEGFLKEHLSADVLNLSVSGGSFDTAMLQWLGSEEYKIQKPKIVIWEFPVYQSFRDQSFYKQAIPAIYGECPSNALFAESFQIKDNKFQIPLGESLDVSRSYMSLSFPKFSKDKFRLSLNYEEGTRESFDFKRSKFYEADGRFFLDIKGQEPLVSIDGVLPKGADVEGYLQICDYPPEALSVE